MSLKILNQYSEELGWKSIILYFGFFSFINLGYWIIQFIAYQLYFENKFFSKRFFKITYFFGWIYTIILLFFIFSLII